jgi:hypothetical protein
VEWLLVARLTSVLSIAWLASGACDAGGGSEPPVAATGAPAPDLVLVLVDTLRADHLGAYGYPRPSSPNIDALAARGLRFERAYAHSGWTLPSVASLLTGRLPHEHGAGRAATGEGRFGRIPDHVRTLAEDLAASGYATHAIVNNTFLAPGFGFARGFDGYDYRGATNLEHRSALDSVARALDWLDAAPRPAFLLLHLMEPHFDYRPPDDLHGRFAPGSPTSEAGSLDRERVLRALDLDQADLPEAQRAWLVARYDEEVLAVDRAVGALARGLERRGRLRDTLLVLTADHGEEFWDHGGFEHGHSLFGELTRVPLVAAGPDIEPGVTRAVVSHRDLYWGLRARAGLAGTPPGGECGAVDLFDVAAREGGDARLVLMENTNRGPPRLAAVDARLHLELWPRDKRAELWHVDEAGADTRRAADEEARGTGLRMLERVARCRGGLEVEEPAAFVGQLDEETFEQLHALGYLEE